MKHNSNAGKYFGSVDGESYNSGPYDSFEAAIVGTPNDYALSDGDVFYVGVGVDPGIPPVCIDSVIDILLDQAYEDVGEGFVGDWLQDYPELAMGELDEQLNKLLKDWIIKHGLYPQYVKIQNIRKYICDNKTAKDITDA